MDLLYFAQVKFDYYGLCCSLYRVSLIILLPMFWLKWFVGLGVGEGRKYHFTIKWRFRSSFLSLFFYPLVLVNIINSTLIWKKLPMDSKPVILAKHCTATFKNVNWISCFSICFNGIIHTWIQNANVKIRTF